MKPRTARESFPKRTVWWELIVIVAPSFDLGSCIFRRQEPVYVPALISTASVERLHDATRTAFAHVVVGLEVYCAESLLRQAHPCFEVKSFNIRTSSESSATLFFSSVFSRPSSRSFFASETSIAPNLLRQR